MVNKKKIVMVVASVASSVSMLCIGKVNASASSAAAPAAESILSSAPKDPGGWEAFGRRHGRRADLASYRRAVEDTVKCLESHGLITGEIRPSVSGRRLEYGYGFTSKDEAERVELDKKATEAANKCATQHQRPAEKKWLEETALTDDEWRTAKARVDSCVGDAKATGNRDRQKLAACTNGLEDALDR